MNWVYLALFLIVLAVVLYVLKLLVERFRGEEMPYRLKKYFFNRSEQEFFRILSEQLDRERYAIFPKVRLGDFIEVDKPKGERLKYWNYIRSKHIDFLIWDIKRGKLSLAIELDGASHRSDRVRERDERKDRLYEAVGLPLVRVQVGSDFNTEVQNIKELFETEPNSSS